MGHSDTRTEIAKRYRRPCRELWHPDTCLYILFPYSNTPLPMFPYPEIIAMNLLYRCSALLVLLLLSCAISSA